MTKKKEVRWLDLAGRPSWNDVDKARINGKKEVFIDINKCLKTYKKIYNKILKNEECNQKFVNTTIILIDSIIRDLNGLKKKHLGKKARTVRRTKTGKGIKRR